MARSNKRRRVECACCGRTARSGAHGWCHACAQRWYKAGRPDSGPPAPSPFAVTGSARAAAQARKRERIARWRELREAGLDRAAISAELGVCPRTLLRYARWEKATGCEVDRVMALLRDSGLWKDAA